MGGSNTVLEYGECKAAVEKTMLGRVVVTSSLGHCRFAGASCD